MDVKDSGDGCKKHKKTAPPNKFGGAAFFVPYLERGEIIA
jgi:hypothetical protein